jgi:hypothetical protein
VGRSYRYRCPRRRRGRRRHANQGKPSTTLKPPMSP